MKTTAQHILTANAAGLRHGESGMWSYYTHILQVAYNLGCRGIDLSKQPVVSGWRYGQIPDSGLSKNYRDDISERGLSLMEADGADTVADWVSAMYIVSGNRPVVHVTGVLLPYTGSDGEPLVLPVGTVEYLDD